MGRTLELLAAVTLVNGGFERVLNAFTDAAAELNRKERFSIIVEVMKHQDGKDISAAIAALQLLNGLITNHEEFETRFYLRCEIYRTSDLSGSITFRDIAIEMEKLLQEEKQNDAEADLLSSNQNNDHRTPSVVSMLSTSQSTSFKKYRAFFQIFINSKNEDFDEMASRFENLRYDFDDVDDCFRALRNSVAQTPASTGLLSILQSLLFIPDDKHTK